MALEGNVKDFGLSEILQLIALQKKSGMLSITGDETVAVFFKDGMVISTRDRRSRTRDPLKDYLLRYGFIGRDEMNKIQQIQVETNLDLTDILVSEKHFSEDELRVILADQVQESLQDVLSWPKSYYKFIIGKNILHNVKYFTPLKVEGLLMESMRRIDEFPELQRIFPSEEMVVRRVEMAAENPPQLDRREEYIYEILEWETTLAELIPKAHMARFCTYESLKSLLEKGLLEILKEPKFEVEVVEEVVEEKIAGKKRFLPTFAIFVTLLTCFVLGEYVVPMILPPGWNSGSTEAAREVKTPRGASLAASLRELEIRQLEASVREGLEEYYASKGSYPFALEILAVRRIVPKELIGKVQQNGIRYSLRQNGTSYSLARQ